MSNRSARNYIGNSTWTETISRSVKNDHLAEPWWDWGRRRQRNTVIPECSSLNRVRGLDLQRPDEIIIRYHKRLMKLLPLSTSFHPCLSITLDPGFSTFLIIEISDIPDAIRIICNSTGWVEISRLRWSRDYLVISLPVGYRHQPSLRKKMDTKVFRQFLKDPP